MNNADRLRNMSNEELANWIDRLKYNCCDGKCCDCEISEYDADCEGCCDVLEWLEKECDCQ